MKRVLAVALALTAGATAGCKSKKAKEKETAAVAAIEGLSAIPSAADVVVGADVPLLASSEVVQRAISRMLLGDPGLSKQLDELFGACGISPARDLRSVVLAMDSVGGPGDGDRALMVVSGTLSEAKVAACVGQHMTAVGGALAQKQEGGRTHYHADAPPGRQDVWFAFGSEHTVVASSSPEFLAEALADGPRLTDDASLVALIDRGRRPGAALWAAGRISKEVGEGLRAASGGQLGAPSAMFGHLVLADGLAGELGAEMDSAETANSAVSMAKTQLAVLSQVAQKWKLGRLVAKVVVEAEDATVFVRLKLTADELRAALAPIDSEAAGDQTTAPLEQNQGVVHHGEGDAAPGSQTPVPEQGKAD